jgi:hypothetical protein
LSSSAQLIKLAVEREWKRRERQRLADLLAAFTLEAIADGHGPQLRAMVDEARYAIWLCSRRAGKTVGVAGRLARRSIAVPGGNRVYIGLTKDQAREMMWEPIWLPLLKRYGIEAQHDETRMVTYFDNGSRVRMTGTDDVRHIETELGSALDDAVIDESQSQGDNVLVPLVERILPPALGDRRGGLLLAGTVPEVETGLFWRTWLAGAWSQHNWSMFQNPHFRDPAAIVQEHLDKNPGLTIDSPQIRREYFGEFVFDETVTAYRYNRERNGYSGEPSAKLTNFSVGIDPGTVDRTAIVAWGWSAQARDLWQVHERVWPKRSHVQWSEIAAECQVISRKFPGARFRYDAGSSKNELDTFQRDYGIPVIRAAQKADMPGQVRRFNDLLTQGRAHLLIGSELEQDMLKTRWDLDARARGQFRWSSHWHPDVADAGRYGAQDYFDLFVAPKVFVPKSEDQRETESVQDILNPPEPESWEDMGLRRLGL